MIRSQAEFASSHQNSDAASRSITDRKKPTMKRRKTALALVLSAGLMLAGCSNGAPEKTDTPAASADVERAAAEVAPYLEAPTAFPLTVPLENSAAGKRVAYLDCGTPVCAMGWESSNAAAAALGVELVRIDAALQADKVQAAFDTIEGGGFDGVIDVALPHALAQSGLTRMKELGIPVVSAAVVNGDPELYGAMLMSNQFFERIGEIYAAYIVSEFGSDADTVFYIVPELELTTIIFDGFERKYTELCPDCKLRVADIPVTSIGSSAPTIITDDLQANPNTNVVALSTAEAAIGLPVALATAGIDDVTITGNGPTGDALRQINEGEMQAGIGYDFVYHHWSTHDALARLMTGQALDPAAEADEIPTQILLQPSITDELVQAGIWTAFPTSEFEKLWSSAR